MQNGSDLFAPNRHGAQLKTLGRRTTALNRGHC